MDLNYIEELYPGCYPRYIFRVKTKEGWVKTNIRDAEMDRVIETGIVCGKPITRVSLVLRTSEGESFHADFDLDELRIES